MPGLFVFEQRTEEYKVIKMTISLLTKSHSCVAKFFVFTCTFVPYFSYTKQKSGWIARIFQLQTNATYFCKQSSFSYRLNTSEHRKNIKVYLLTKSSSWQVIHIFTNYNYWYQQICIYKEKFYHVYRKPSEWPFLS